MQCAVVRRGRSKEPVAVNIQLNRRPHLTVVKSIAKDMARHTKILFIYCNRHGFDYVRNLGVNILLGIWYIPEPSVPNNPGCVSF